jgi:hypothetical protein
MKPLTHPLVAERGVSRERDWTGNTYASRILATFVDRPAPYAMLDPEQRWTNDPYVPTGFRVWLLRVIRSNILTAKLHAAEAAGNQAAADRVCRQITVQDAVERAMIPAPVMQVAA